MQQTIQQCLLADLDLPHCCTHHLCVSDLGQQVCQVVSTQPLVGVVKLQATDSGSHAAGGDHGRRVHGQTVICCRKRNNVILVKQQLLTKVGEDKS